MTTFDIKVITPKDKFYIDQCLEIAKDNHVDNGGKLSYYMAVKDGCDYIICAIKGEKVLGYLGVNKNLRQEFVVVQIAVGKDEREKGVGTALLQYLKHHSKSVKQIISFADKDNIPSINMHKKSGFKQIDEEYDYYFELKTEKIKDNQTLEFTDEKELEGE